jgi:outer membrane protein OmpA-like peptidoglycan-associated protein
MFAKVVKPGGKGRDQAEKPFWISYADLMTALMVLFLVVMSVTLLAVTKTVTEQDRRKSSYDAAIEALLADVQAAVDLYPGLTLDRERRVIDFGPRAEFQFRDYHLPPDKAQYLRLFVPNILNIANSARGKDLLKRIVVEGFTDETGTYLYNLNLSLQRSESVLCALLENPERDETPLSDGQRKDIRDLFLVSGFSFNSARATADESRRVEFRLELYGFGEAPAPVVSHPTQEIGKCAVSS